MTDDRYEIFRLIIEVKVVRQEVSWQSPKITDKKPKQMARIHLPVNYSWKENPYEDRQHPARRPRMKKTKKKMFLELLQTASYFFIHAGSHSRLNSFAIILRYSNMYTISFDTFTNLCRHFHKHAQAGTETV